ncbi:adenylate/guanylate cyclase domain-containing protein [Mucilaginibacter sp. Bleaf8]|uniref:adenylate/guanylate cyclase domain-containing protein n=1 Tax=Mucilaginibacter sp. Bleaf8 TaxID=2834430 RepID=UPI001BCFDAD5|nr:adenylate/guanylate cyclase domain-containing protein [Mucilaginibacter sp. Bleaf8]MBS7564113.1 adenylate/guanylate cyclase domain-containing protein [Mucilaginibacter sp. Bleaf8]
MENNSTPFHSSAADALNPHKLLKDGELLDQLCAQSQNMALCKGTLAANAGSFSVSADTEQELAIMFLDIRNFTGLMESRPAKEVVQVVRRLFSGFNQIINHFKGTVVEMAGDSLYAVFGLSTDIKEAINQGYEAAKNIFSTISWFNDAYATPYYNHPLEIGIGLHTGNVVVGQFGLQSPAQLSVMGLPVNIASRLQAKTKEVNNDMLISEEAYRHLEANNEKHEQRTVNLKGISLPQMVRLLGKPYLKRFTANGNSQDMDYLLAISG